MCLLESGLNAQLRLALFEVLQPHPESTIRSDRTTYFGLLLVFLCVSVHAFDMCICVYVHMCVCVSVSGCG